MGYAFIEENANSEFATSSLPKPETFIDVKELPSGSNTSLPAALVAVRMMEPGNWLNDSSAKKAENIVINNNDLIGRFLIV